MNRRHVLQTLAVMSASSTTIVAFGGSSSAFLAATSSQTPLATLQESRDLCIDLLTRIERAESRRDLIAGSDTAIHKSATHALQELLVLLERTEARVSDRELRAVALMQACVDSLLRVEKPLIGLCQEGMLPRPVVDSSVAVFGQARKLLSGLSAV